MKKILIAEDEKPIARALKLKLDGIMGFSTQIVFNGKDAIELLERENFDIVVLDLMMPKMNGFEVMTEMKGKNIHIPIIVITNLGQEEDLKKVQDLGVNDYFVKSDTPILEIVNHIKKKLA